MNEQDYEVVDMMEKYGGSFVKTLSVLCRHADHINLHKIKTAWPEYWEEYKKMVKEHNKGEI